MGRLGSGATRVWKTLPSAYWTFLGLTCLALFLSWLPAETEVSLSLSLAGVLIWVALFAGVTFGSRTARLALAAYSALGALSILLIQSHFPEARDLALVVILLTQAWLLCSPGIRRHTAKQ